MKLRNKKTGKIINSKELITDEFLIDIFSKDFNYFNSKINKLQEEWEDYEEPKNNFFQFAPALLDNKFVALIVDEKCNREEAERAVEKLKAWKRLKDKGFKFDGWDENHHNLGIIEFSFPIVGESVWDFEKDLDLLFGGEE